MRWRKKQEMMEQQRQKMRAQMRAKKEAWKKWQQKKRGGRRGRGRVSVSSKRRGGNKNESRQRPTREQMEKMQKMQQAMKELGPCAEVVKKTMMECFFVMEAGVREALGDEGAGITKDVAVDIGSKSGKCYENGLNDLSNCLARQQGPPAGSDGEMSREDMMEKMSKLNRCRPGYGFHIRGVKKCVRDPQ